MNTTHINFLELSYQFEHDMYFSINHLLRYGYFDFKYSDQHEDDYILSKYVYKQIFNTDQLASAYSKVTEKVAFKSYVDTAPIELSIYKNEAERRIYKLPNIYSYISLCRHLEQYKSTYLKIISNSHQSLSKHFHDPFYKGKQRREENRLGKKHIMKTDIQNFYPSIYTHSIPWVLVGKDEAKAYKNDKNKYYNELDSLIQRCQKGETHGLPTGSFASRLIAELYMCKLDEIMCSFSYVRFVDDFEFSYNDESEKGNFYKKLNTELNKLNLKLKVEKNQIDTFPFQGDHNSAFFFDYFFNIEDEKNQTRRIYNFIDSSIYKEREGYKGALKLMFKSLKSSIIDARITQQSLTRHIFKQLFNMVLMTPHLSVYFMEFINVLDGQVINHSLRPSIIQMKAQIQNNIDRYLDLSYHQELYSLLSIFLFIGVNNACTTEQLIKIVTSMDDLSAILALELLVTDDQNVNNTLFESIESKLQNSTSWEEEYWLFKYHFFHKLNKHKKFSKEYKNFIYQKYDNGIEKSKFFNPKNLASINSPITLAAQNKNSNADISTFFKALFDNDVSFFIGEF